MMYTLANGQTVSIPEEGTFVVNGEDAENAEGVCAVAVKNAPKGTPVFFYFMTKKVSHLRRDPDLNRIDEAIAEAWPAYRKILQRKVELIPDGNGGDVNINEWREAPEPGYFTLESSEEYLVADAEND